MNPKRKTQCQSCGSDAEEEIIADDWEDAPASFTLRRTCNGPCKKSYLRMAPNEMHELTGRPLAGWASNS